MHTLPFSVKEAPTPHLLALVHEEMLLHVAVIIIRGIFAREQSCQIGLLLLYLSILEIGGKRTGKLALASSFLSRTTKLPSPCSSPLI